MEVLVDPLPKGAYREGTLYPDGAHLKDLKVVRDLCYQLQRPGIAPQVSCDLHMIITGRVLTLVYSSVCTPIHGEL